MIDSRTPFVGKVKFLKNGAGGGGQTIQLLPIMFGSNNMITPLRGAMLPINSTQYFNDGVDTPNDVLYSDNVDATSYLPSIDNPYFYYITNGVIKVVGTNSVSVELELYIDGVVVETIPLDLNAGNSYTSLFAFSQTPNLNEYPVSRYGVRVSQTSGIASQFEVSTTSVFLSIFDNNTFKSEFFTSSNLTSLKIFESGDFKYVGFGGQTNANSLASASLSSSVVGSVTTFDLRKIYIMFDENIGGAIGDLVIDFYVNDVVVESFSQQVDFIAYFPYVFTLSNPYTMSNLDTMYILLTNNSNEAIRIFEIGIYGYEIID